MSVNDVSTVAVVIAIICISTLLGLKVATWRLQEAWRRLHRSHHRLNQQWAQFHGVETQVHRPCEHCPLLPHEIT